MCSLYSISPLPTENWVSILLFHSNAELTWNQLNIIWKKMTWVHLGWRCIRWFMWDYSYLVEFNRIRIPTSEYTMPHNGCFCLSLGDECVYVVESWNNEIKIWYQFTATFSYHHWERLINASLVQMHTIYCIVFFIFLYEVSQAKGCFHLCNLLANYTGFEADCQPVFPHESCEILIESWASFKFGCRWLCCLRLNMDTMCIVISIPMRSHDWKNCFTNFSNNDKHLHIMEGPSFPF